jgi:hypothetical protein
VSGRTVDDALERAIEDAVSRMTPDQQEHFKQICGMLLAAYIDEGMHALVLLGQHEELAQVMAVNCTDIVAARLVGGAAERIDTLIMQDAPERSMFH